MNELIPRSKEDLIPLAPLDPDQEKVVLSQEKNILVVAGAGSGKTRVLVERIKHLINLGVDPINIVAITFTNMAADEMKERLRNVPGIGDAFIGTIHSFANRIYRTSGEPYRLLTDEEHRLIMEEILNRPENKDLTIKRYLAYMDLCHEVEMGKKDEAYLLDFLTQREKYVLDKCPAEIERIRKRDHLITFDELIEYATAFYKSLNASIEYILVDELQDIGTSEYKFIRALNAEHYFFVGDDYQAIYGFKGGNVEIFKRLCNRDKNFTTYFLNRNYRSKKAIIDFAESIIRQVPDRIRKKAVLTQSGSGSVEFHNKSNTAELADILLRDKPHWCDYFVLTRTNREAYQLADVLDDHLIDYCFIRRTELTLDELRDAMRSNMVKIMTVHASKGLESPNVILFGKFPLKVPPYFTNYDERKVMYVGITRAINKLHLFN